MNSAGGTTILAVSLHVVALSCLACLSQIAQGRDTVTITEPLRYGDVLVSPGDMYELGFFQPATSNNNTYLGMWYKHVPGRTVVWVANRAVPVTDFSGSLTIGQEGNAIIVDGGGVQVWSTNLTSSAARLPILQLLGTGNLVLRDEGDESGEGQSNSSYLWQSFDYPTDSMLPGIKLGWDLRIGLERKLTSWRSSTDPSPGDYTFTIVPQGLPSIFMMHRSVPTYRSGAWNGVRFSGVPEMRSNYVFNFQFVSNYPVEVYYAYTLQNASMMSRLMVNPDGVLQRLTWVEQSRNWSTFWSAPKDQCDNFMECGPYGICNTDDSPVCQCPPGFEPRSAEAWYLRDGSDGCVRSVELQCGESDGFLRLEGVKLPESRAALVDMGMSIDECEAACRSNCSCMGYAAADVSGGGRSGCVRWHEPLRDIRAYRSGTVDDQVLFVRVPASVLGGSHSRRVVIIATVTVAAALALLLAACLFYIYKKKLKKAPPRKEPAIRDRSEDFLMFDLGPCTSMPNVDTPEEHMKDDLELPLLDLGSVMAATNHFSDDNKLGEGGFGPVYKGKLPSGQEVAVKRLSKNSGQGLDEFKNEVILIAKLQHRNLVRLLGCCIQGEEKMLVYEFMPNKSLDSFIFDDARRKLLDWRQRFHIIVGIARGLLYLHQDSRLRIIHRDLKASNILLDNKMNPRISDFGMARIFGADETEANTKRVVGTYGYMSPEYAMDGLFSVKSDVFSFGVLVLEIVSGQKNRGFYQTEQDANLLARAWRLWKEGKGLEMMDETIVNNSCPISEVLRCIQVGLLCVQERAEDRPTMSNVVFMLGSENPTLSQPKQPGYCTGRNETETDSASSRQESITANHLTVTVVQGR